MDLFDENIGLIRQRAGRLPVRIATKSLRCFHLIEYLLKADPQFIGVMSFSAEEAVYLSKKGIDDILIAYPETNELALTMVAREIGEGKHLTLMVDDPAHVELLEKVGASLKTSLPVCIDVDVSVDFPGLHFGVWRSPVRDGVALRRLLEVLKKTRYVQLQGIMGYESQIAGVTDKVRGQRLMNTVKRFLKQLSFEKINEKRQKAVEIIRNEGFNLKFVNGGGTGSIETTQKDRSVTEVTAGSGFYNSHLFDNYKSFSLLPAAGFGCAISRIPKKGIYTCAGGGYVASGAIEKLKAPLPVLPEGVRLTENESAGEVQTPVIYEGKEPLSIGDPIFFRHSKAGELCERFKVLQLIRKGKIEQVVNTYRGDGQCFI